MGFFCLQDDNHDSQDFPVDKVDLTKICKQNSPFTPILLEKFNFCSKMFQFLILVHLDFRLL